MAVDSTYYGGWAKGTVTLPSGRVVAAMKSPTTGEIFRVLGLYIAYPGRRPVGKQTATTFTTEES